MNNLARLYAQTGKDPNRALALAEQTTKAQPNRPPLLDTLGRIYYLVGRSNEAAKVLQQAADLAPADPNLKR